MRGYLRDQVVFPEAARISPYFLRLLQKGPRQPIEIYDALADLMELNSAQRTAKRRTAEELAWHNRMQTVRKQLVERGLLKAGPRGYWQLTKEGREEAEKEERIAALTPEEIAASL